MAVSTALHAEDRAFESLYRLHRPPVYAYALSTLRHPADAEDVTQTTFLNAYTALHRGVAPRDDLQWLLAIARNVCRDRFRDAKRHPKEEALEDWIRLVQPEEPDYSVGEIFKEISELSPRYRQILLMREFEGRSYAEISAQLGVSEPAVQALLTRARRALRDELELGMTCAHARRMSLRHLNGVALIDERRALQRHLRRCAECASFVGRTPRTPVAHMLWLVWLPYRRLMTIFAATSAPSGTTAGGAGALAAKLVAATVVGGAAVGVTVTEVAKEPTFGHSKRTPAGSIAVSPAHRSGGQTHVSAAAIAWSTAPQLSRGRVALTRTSHQIAQPPAKPSGSTAPAEVLPQATGVFDPSSATRPESVPGAPVAPEQPAAAQPAAAPQDLVAAADTGDTASASPAPASSPSNPSTDALGTPTTDPAASNVASASGSDPAAAGSTTPPVTSGAPPPTQAQGLGRGNGNANAVGQGGTPPGQAAKDDPPAHGHP
jgi:RNA polymerase sigma-70 factor (ECF subfamily)